MAYPGLVYVCAKERYPMGSKDWAVGTGHGMGLRYADTRGERRGAQAGGSPRGADQNL